MIYETKLKKSVKIAIALILFIVATISALATLFSWKLGEMAPLVSIPAMMLFIFSFYELTGIKIYLDMRNEGVDFQDRINRYRLPGHLVDSFDGDEDFSGEYLNRLPEPLRANAKGILRHLINEVRSEIDYESSPEMTRDEALELLRKKKTEVPVHELFRLQIFLGRHDEFLEILKQNEILYRNAIGLLNQKLKTKLKTVAVLDEDPDIKESFTTQIERTNEDSSEVREL